MQFLPTFGTLALVASLSPPASACSICGADDPLVAASASSPKPGALRLALDYTAVRAAAASDDDPSITERLERLSLTPTLVYTPFAQLNLVMDAPLVRSKFARTGRGIASEETTLVGVGDAELGLRFFVVSDVDWARQRRQELAVSGGSAFPTGPNGSERNGQRLDEHAQLGRGALGPYLGLLYAFHQDPWNFNLSVVGRGYSENRFGYRYGNAVLVSAALQFRPWSGLAFELGTHDRDAAYDHQSGVEQSNTGGLVLQVSPGLLARITGRLWYQTRVEIPVATRLHGRQWLGPTYVALLQYAL